MGSSGGCFGCASTSGSAADVQTTLPEKVVDSFKTNIDDLYKKTFSIAPGQTKTPRRVGVRFPRFRDSPFLVPKILDFFFRGSDVF